MKKILLIFIIVLFFACEQDTGTPEYVEPTVNETEEMPSDPLPEVAEETTEETPEEPEPEPAAAPDRDWETSEK